MHSHLLAVPCFEMDHLKFEVGFPQELDLNLECFLPSITVLRTQLLQDMLFFLADTHMEFYHIFRICLGRRPVAEKLIMDLNMQFLG